MSIHNSEKTIASKLIENDIISQHYENRRILYRSSLISSNPKLILIGDDTASLSERIRMHTDLVEHFPSFESYRKYYEETSDRAHHILLCRYPKDSTTLIDSLDMSHVDKVIINYEVIFRKYGSKATILCNTDTVVMSSLMNMSNLLK